MNDLFILLIFERIKERKRNIASIVLLYLKKKKL